MANSPDQIDRNRKIRNRERKIEMAVMSNPDMLGYAGALAIRNWRVAETSGRLDVALLPTKGPRKLVLVEAKATKSGDAAYKVVGQLLMYYAGALTLGSKGLTCLRNFAKNNEANPCDTSIKSMIRLSGGIRPTTAAWEHLSSGKPLLPKHLRLFIALDNKPHKFLEAMLRALRRDKIFIGLVIVRNGVISEVVAPSGKKKFLGR